MKTFKKYIREQEDNPFPSDDKVDHAAWLDDFYREFCKDRPNHIDCEDYVKSQQKKGGKK